MQVGICPVAYKNPVNGLKYLVRVKKNFSAMVLGTPLRGAAGVRSWSEDPGHRGDHGLSFLPMWTNRLGFDRVLPRWAVGAVVAHFVHTEGVAGSNPASPTRHGVTKPWPHSSCRVEWPMPRRRPSTLLVALCFIGSSAPSRVRRAMHSAASA